MRPFTTKISILHIIYILTAMVGYSAGMPQPQCSSVHEGMETWWRQEPEELQGAPWCHNPNSPQPASQIDEPGEARQHHRKREGTKGERANSSTTRGPVGEHKAAGKAQQAQAGNSQANYLIQTAKQVRHEAKHLGNSHSTKQSNGKQQPNRTNRPERLTAGNGGAYPAAGPTTASSNQSRPRKEGNIAHERTRPQPAQHWERPVDRIGEARHPGPETFKVGTINPTLICGKEELVMQMGHGIWGLSESSHTEHSVPISDARFAKQGYRAIWSKPCQPHAKYGGIRGRAGGTAVVASYPIRRGPPLPKVADDSTRITEAIVQLSPQTCMQVISIYGPPKNDTYANPTRLLETIVQCAYDRALPFKGPAVIMGDFNAHLEDTHRYHEMVARGWRDLHVESG